LASFSSSFSHSKAAVFLAFSSSFSQAIAAYLAAFSSPFYDNFASISELLIFCSITYCSAFNFEILALFS